MKAWRAKQFGAPAEVLRLEEIELPPPRPGFIAVKVAAAGIALPDVLMLKGLYPMVKTPPVSPGMEATGIAVAVGEGVSGFAIGDRIMATAAAAHGWGGFAEFCFADASKAFKVPRGMSDIDAAGFILPYKTAYAALVLRTKLCRGETLLVLGATGSSGAAAVQLGKALGAVVIAVASSPEKLAFCRDIGADHVLNYKTEDIVARVKEITDGRGVDVAFDPVGGELGKLATLSMARLGRFGLIGFASGSWTMLDPHDLILRNYSAVGIFAGALAQPEIDTMIAELTRLAEDGLIRTSVAKVFGFDETLEAIAAQEYGNLAGKLILQVT